MYTITRYTHLETLEEEHETVSAMETEERRLSVVVDEITRRYTVPVLIIWYTLNGTLEFYCVRSKSFDITKV
jgi:L-lysine 2,3-aminomutase